jgi:hypothetical protein
MGPFDGDFLYFCYLFLGSFLLVAGVVVVFWCYLLILRQLGIFGVGTYFRRSVAWVFSPALDDELDEDPA